MQGYDKVRIQGKMCLLKPLLPKCQPHLLVVYPVVIDEALMTESQQYKHYLMCNLSRGWKW